MRAGEELLSRCCLSLSRKMSRNRTTNLNRKRHPTKSCRNHRLRPVSLPMYSGVR